MPSHFCPNLLCLLTLLSLSHVSLSNFPFSYHHKHTLTNPVVPETPDLNPPFSEASVDSNSSPTSGSAVDLSGYTNLLSTSSFDGQWFLAGKSASNNFQSFQNNQGIIELETVAAGPPVGNSSDSDSQVNPTPARLLLETLDFAPPDFPNTSSTQMQLLIKIYDGEYVDQQSVHINYQLNSTGNLTFSADTATMSELYSLSDLSFTQPNGKQITYQTCLLNISIAFLNANTMTPYQGPFTSENDMGITVNISSSDCNFTLQTYLLTSDGLYSTSRVIVYIIVSCIISLIQIVGVILVKKSFEKRKYLFNVSTTSVFFTVTIDYYVLILNFIVVFADSALLAIPLAFNVVLTFVLERDLILRLFQGRAKRQGTTLSDDDCKTFGCYFVVISIFFVIELAFLLMYQMWILYFTSLVLIPQIAQNMLKDRAYQFNYPHIFLMVVPKVLMVAYVKLYPGNLFRLSPDPLFFAMYALLVLAQIAILHAQIRYPRFCFSPEHVRKASKALEEDDLCPICMGHLANHNSDISPTFPRKKTIQTNCTHSFHTQCLRKWLNKKTECPMCRNNIADLLEEGDFSEDDARSSKSSDSSNVINIRRITSEEESYRAL